MHDILSSTHGDSLPASVVHGDVIVGNATPAWARLAANATGTKKYLQSVSGGTPSWQSEGGGPRLPSSSFGVWFPESAPSQRGLATIENDKSTISQGVLGPVSTLDAGVAGVRR